MFNFDSYFISGIDLTNKKHFLMNGSGWIFCEKTYDRIYYSYKVIEGNRVTDKINSKVIQSNNGWDYEICTNRTYTFYVNEPRKESPANDIQIIGTRVVSRYSYGSATTRVSGAAIIDTGFEHEIVGSKPNKIWMFMEKQIIDLARLDDGNKLGDWSELGLFRAATFDPEYYTILKELS